jgi:transposase
VFGSRELVGANLAAFTPTATTSPAAVLGTLYLQQALGYPPTATGLALLPVSLAAIAGSFAGAWLTAKLRARATMALGLATITTAMLLLSRIPTQGGLPWLVAGLVIAGSGLTCAPVRAAPRPYSWLAGSGWRSWSPPSSPYGRAVDPAPGSHGATMTTSDPVPDQLWNAIQPLLPPPTSKPKGGQPRLPDRAVAGATVFMPRAGPPWRLLPARELGAGSPVTCWRRLRDWQQAGVWQQLHTALLDTGDPQNWTIPPPRAWPSTASMVPAVGSAEGPNRDAPARCLPRPR